MFTSKNYIEKPIHLVSINSFGKLVLHYEAISYLKTLKSPLSVLSIAGPYRTGKSFLLNSIISNTQNFKNPNGQLHSFQVGHTTNQTTHGLWIWSKPLLAYDENNQITNVIVMDSQGYASSESTHDKRLITLALLLSTCFLFNSKGAIDKDSIFDLEFVIEVARMIGLKEEIRTSQENMKGKCDFHWILRDFQLELINELGHKITPNEYMENCFLQAESRVNQRTIETLKQYFPQRTCHTLCHPNSDVEAEQRPEFISQIIGLKQSILKKNMKSFNMAGEAFIELLQSYIDSMNEGEQINSVFQEGYDCRVRLDCLEKLNSKLKRLDEQSDDEIDEKLMNIKTQIRQYYKQRMCSHKQITVLNTEVEERITEYQHEYNSSKGLQSGSVKCVERETSYKNVPIIIPKSNYHPSNQGLRKARLSIQCSQNQDKSFLGDEELNEESSKNFHQHSTVSSNNVRASRLVVERRSIEKQKMSPEMKALVVKIEQLQVSLHRTELQLSTAESELAHQKQENQLLRKSLNEKEDQIMETIQAHSVQEKAHLKELQRAEEQKKQLEKQLKLLESQIHKQKLLFEEKIQFLQNELKFGDEARINEFTIEKNKYKQKIRELTQEIEEMAKKHKEETLQVRGIFSQEIERARSKSNYNGDNKSESDSQDIFEEFEEKVKQNQALHKQVESLKINNQKLLQEIQAVKFKALQREQSLKEQLEQLTKRSLQNEEQLKTLYETKLMAKDSQMSQLETRIKSLNEIALNENQRLIDSLKEMEHNFSEEKEDLFVMNNELRNGCLEALQRVSGLKEEIEMKESRCEELQREKGLLLKKLQEQKDEQQKQVKRLKDQEKQFKAKYVEQLQEKQTAIHELECKVMQESHEVQQFKQKSTQLELELEMEKQANSSLQEQLQELNEKLQQLEYNYKEVSEELMVKEQQLHEAKQDFTHEEESLGKEITQLRAQLEEAKQEKASLAESITKINKQLDTKYENLELMFNDKHEYDKKRHEQVVKEMKENEKKLMNQVQEKKLQNIKLSERIKYNEKEIEGLTNECKATKEELSKSKEELQQKVFELQQLQRQTSKSEALLNQKISFVEQKLNILKEESQAKTLENQSKETQFNTVVKSLKAELESTTKTNQQTLKTLQETQHKYEQTQKKLVTLTKQSQEIQAQLMSQVEHLINRQSLTQKDNNTMAQNLLALQQHIRQNQIQTQNHIRLYNHKLNQVKHQKINLQKDLNELKEKYEILMNQHNQLQANYNSDFMLWTKKFNKMEQSLKQAGWSQYDSSSKQWGHYEGSKNGLNQDHIYSKDFSSKLLS